MFNIKDIGHQIKMNNAIATKAAGSETLTSAAIDTLGYASASLFVNAGTATGTPSGKTLNVKVQECDTSDGTPADVSGLAITEMTAAGTSKLSFNLDGRKRYLFVVATVALTGGSSPAWPVSGALILGGAAVNPQS